MSEHTDAMSALRSLDDVSLTCRRGSGIGHAWRVLGWYQHGNETRRVSTCDRCDTDKTDRWVKSNGERLQPHYKHPDGYSLPERPQAYEVRMEVMRRAKVYSSQDAMLAALTEGVGRKQRSIQR